MNLKNLLIENKKSTALLTINRAEKLNALNHETLLELQTSFLQFQKDSSIKVIIITGSGEKAFVAGADIDEINKLDKQKGREFAGFGQSVFNLIENLGKPVIAAVNGFALGGGCELVLACHIRYASVNAKFGQPEVKLGIIPGYGGTQRLSRLINSGRAAELILSGDIVSAEEAYRIGLVNKIFSAEELLERSFELADKISSFGQIAVRKALECIKMTGQLSLAEGLKFEAQEFAECCDTQDFIEGTSAFLQKRKPNFKNS